MLELYNTTNDVKRIPKYKYNGKFVIPSHGSVKIEDEQAYFFKPYAKVGIVIRKLVEDSNIEEADSIKDSDDSMEEGTDMEEIAIASDIDNESDSESGMEEIFSVVLETEDDKEEEDSNDIYGLETLNKYTEGGLKDMSIGQLREVAKELGVDISGIRKKVEIRDKIIENLWN